MPQTVEVPELGIVEFPDDMTPDSISAILRKRTQPKEPEPFPVIPPSPARTPEELSYRNMMGEQALGTAVPAPVAHGPLLDVPAALPETLIRASMKVPIPSLAQAIRLLPESEREPAIKGISESAAEGLSGLTTPENLAIGAGLAIAPEIGLPLLVAHMQSQVPEALQAIDEAETPQQKWKARANLAQLAGMIVAPAAKPILKGLRGTERVQAEEQPVPPVIPRGPEPPPLPVEAPPEPPPPIPKPIERVVEDYVEPEPTETVVKGEEFVVPAPAAEVLPEAARAAEEAGAKIEQPAAKAAEPSFQPPRYPHHPTAKGLSDTEKKAAFDEYVNKIAVFENDLSEWDASIPENRPIIFDSGPNINAITKDPKGGWRTTSFSKQDRMPTGHERYATRQEAIKYEVVGGAKRIEKIPFEVIPLPHRMYPGDMVIWRAPGTGEDVIVNFRGFLGGADSGKAVIVTDKGHQMSVNAMDLRRQTTEKGVTTDAERIPEKSGEVSPQGLQPERGEAKSGYPVEPRTPGQSEPVAARTEAPVPRSTGAEVLLKQGARGPWKGMMLDDSFSQQQKGYPQAREALMGWSDADLASEKAKMTKASLDPMFGANAVKVLNLINEEIAARKPSPPAEPTPAKAKEPGAGGEKKQRKIGQQQIRHLFDRETEAIGGTDILDWISQNMRLMSKSAAKKKMGSRFARNKGEYDDAPRVPVHHNERIYGGNALPDQVAQAAYEARVLRSPDVTELWQAVDRASKTRRKAIGTEAREGSTLETAADFVEKATEPSTDKLNQPVDELRVGDAFEIEGQRIEVVKIEEDGTAVLKDGTRWGIQRISPDQTVWVESFEPSESEAIIQAPQTKTTSGEPFKLDEPESVEQQKARLAREEEARKAKEAKATIEAKSAAPLIGSTGDIGQGDLLGGGDLFSGKPPTAEPGKGPGMVGMGGAVPGEFARAGGSPAATKFRMMDEARVARGLEPLLKPQSVKDQVVLDRALAEYDKDPAGADALADSLIRNPKPIEDWQNHYLLLRWIDTRDQFYKSAREAQLADADGRMADMARSNEQTSRWSDAMTKLEKALRLGGSETGRALRARQVLIAEDFTLAGLETRRRAALGGRPLTPDERAELVKIADEYKKTADALKTKLSEETAAKARIEQALADLRKEVAGQPRLDQRVLDYAERFVSGMEEIADRYTKELTGAVWSPTPDMLAKAAFIGATKIARGIKDLAQWTDEMALNLGDKFRPYAKQVFDMSQKVLTEQTKKLPQAVQKAVKMVSPEDRRGAWKKEIAKRVQKDQDKAEFGGLIKKIARTYVEQGINEREALINAVYGDINAIAPNLTRRDVMDAISGYGDFRPVSKDAVSVILRDLKGQMQQVAKLEDMTSGVSPSKTGFERRTPSDIERRLIKQVEEAKRKGGYTVTDPATQLRTAMDAIKKRLMDQISDLEAQIAARQKIVKQPTRLQYDQEALDLKARRDELKRVFDEVFPKEPLTDAQRLERWKAHTETRIAEFERRVRERDFSKRGIRPPPPMDEAALGQMDRLEKIKEQYHELLLRDKYRNMRLHEKAWVATKEALNIPRNVMTSADLSAVLRQGGMLSASHPIMAGRAFVPMLKGMASERLAGIVDQEILNRPNAKSGRYAQAKLYLAPLRSTTLSAMEEQVMSRFAHHIPLVRASNRAFITFLNRIRADAFDAFTENLEKGGKPLTDVELKAIGNYINVSTGRGELGPKYGAAAEAMATLLFSPRLVASRFQLLAGQPFYRGTGRTKALVAQEYARSLTGLAVFLGLGAMAGATLEFDPRSSDFGKLRFGNTRIDPMAGLSQSTVLLSRTASRLANLVYRKVTGERLLKGDLKSTTGKFRELGGKNVKFGQGDLADIYEQFARNKLAPVVGGALTALSEREPGGQPIQPEEVGLQMLTPLSFSDIGKMMREQGVGRGTVILMLSLLGMGTQYFEPPKSKR